MLGIFIITLGSLQVAQAQYTPDGKGFPLVSPIDIKSPANTTYATNLLNLNFTVKSYVNMNSANITMVYSLDGNNNISIPISTRFVPVEAESIDANGTKTTIISVFSYYLLSGDLALPELQQGAHSLTVFARYDLSDVNQIGLDNKTVHFIINDNLPPIISNVTLENKIYSQSVLPLNFSANKQLSWAAYSLDGKANVTITGNTTLTDLSNGAHTLTLYVNDTTGNRGKSQTINFAVSQPLVSPSYAVIGVLTIIVIVSILFLTRYKKLQTISTDV